MGFFDKFKKDGQSPAQSPSLYETAPQQSYQETVVSSAVAVDTPPAQAMLQEVEEITPVIAIEEPSEKQTIELNVPELTLDNLLRRLIDLDGSDLHLESGAPPVFRVKGDMRFSDGELLTSEILQEMIFPIIPEREQKIFDKVGNLDFAHEIPELARFRGNLLKQHHGVGAVFRVIPSKIPTIEQLNLPPVLKSLSLAKKGIVIVTGPTGSGKSTTLAAMINYVNQNRKAHIITIEDPIEFTHQSLNCLIDHRQVGHHTRSFAEALKAALREDPDIVLVGEMRDLETIGLAITAAEMGVLVFGTLHTNSAAKTIDRIIDVFPSKQQEQVRSQLSQSLKGIIAQQLLKTADGKGRCAALEILISNSGLANMIREGKTNQIISFIHMGKDEGMQTMDSALMHLVETGKITPDMAVTRAFDKVRFMKMVESKDLG